MKIIPLLLLFLFVSCSDEAESPATESTKSIGTEGGTIKSDDQQISLSIPANALSSTTAIRIVPTTNHPSGALGTVYDLLPDGTQFHNPATLIFSYQQDLIDAAAETNLTLAYAENGVWVPVLSVVDEANNKLSAQITHFTPYGIVYGNSQISEEVCGLVTSYQLPSSVKDGSTYNKEYTFLYDNSANLVAAEAVDWHSEIRSEWSFHYNAEGNLVKATEVRELPSTDISTTETITYDFFWIFYPGDGYYVRTIRESKKGSENIFEYELSIESDDVKQTYYDMMEVSLNDEQLYWIHLPRNNEGKVESLSYSDSLFEYQYDNNVSPLVRTNVDRAVLFAMIKDPIRSFANYNITQMNMYSEGEEYEMSFEYQYDDELLPYYIEATDSRFPGETYSYMYAFYRNHPCQ